MNFKAIQIKGGVDIRICEAFSAAIFLTGPDGDGPSAKDHIFLFLQGTSIGLVRTNTALLSLVDTNRVQYTFI